MKTTRNLRLQIRLAQCALLLLLGLSMTAAVATHQLLLNSANQPTNDIDISGSHVVGTLAAGRLPASVPLLTGDGSLTLAGTLVLGGDFSTSGTIGTNGILSVGSNVVVDSDGSLYAGGFEIADNAGNLCANDSLYVGWNKVADSAGNLYAAGRLVADTDNLYAGGWAVANNSGNLIAHGTLSVDETEVADSSGNLYANGVQVADAEGNLFVTNGLYAGTIGLAIIDQYGNINTSRNVSCGEVDVAASIFDSEGSMTLSGDHSSVTLAPVDPVIISTPSSGVTLYTSNVDGKLYARDAAGSDHALW